MNPTEFICSSSATGTVTKRLVIRNSLSGEVILKLVLSKEAEKFITLEKKSVRIKAIARLNVQIHTDRIGMFGGGGQLKGYVRAYSASPEVDEWATVAGKETKRQLAFSINIRFANVFSARDTVLDLPGSAVVFTLDDRDTQTAHAIEDDCITARNCDSIAEYMAEVSGRRAAAQKKKAEPTNWGIYDMANTVAETVKSWYEATPALPAAAPKKAVKKTMTTTSTRKTRPKSSNSQKSGRSTKVRSSFIETNNGRCKRRTVQMESDYVNHEMMKATPCGGVAA